MGALGRELLPTFTVRGTDWEELGSRTATVLPTYFEATAQEPCYVVQYANGQSDDSLTLYQWDGRDLTRMPDGDRATSVAQAFWAMGPKLHYKE